MQLPHRDRVSRAGRHLVDLERPGAVLGELGDRGQDRVDDHVRGDEIQHHVGIERQGTQAALADRGDQGIGHPQPVEPARRGLREARLDDRRADDRQRHVAAAPQHDLFAERLGVGVGVVPAPLAGQLHALLDELVQDPPPAQVLDRLAARLARAAAAAAALDQRLDELAPDFGAVPPLADAGDDPLDADQVLVGIAEPARGERILGARRGVVDRLRNRLIARAAHVRGRDVDQRGVVALGGELCHAAGPARVERQCVVQRRVEGDDRGAVDDEVEPVDERLAHRRVHSQALL